MNSEVIFVRNFYKNGTQQGQDIFHHLLKETNVISKEFLRSKLIFFLTYETDDLDIIQNKKRLFQLLNSSSVLDTVISDELMTYLKLEFTETVSDSVLQE